MKDSSIQLREVRRMLANVPGLLGVGCGLKETAGKLTPETAWRVYVTKKKPRGCLQLNGRIPHSLLGLPTDVIEREPTLVSSCEGLLDSSDGTMIANKKGVPGTLGCWARYVATGQLVLLSNYHVLFGKKCKQGDTIWRVHRWGAEYDYQSIGKNLVGKASTITFRGIDYFIDAAIGELNEACKEIVEQVVSGRQCWGVGEAALGSFVSKTGAATQQTSGMVVDICYPDRWYSDFQSADAPNQILIQPIANSPAQKISEFSRMGDSGAVIRNEIGCLVGLLWGSNARGEGIACHIAPIVNELGIQLELVSDDGIAR